ncbi:MAG: hypothetical protein QOE57_588 [Acidimicrobiaceae bacterium]|nr:hypothetical protein [Acidimicrobiaceae bacterium]
MQCLRRSILRPSRLLSLAHSCRLRVRRPTTSRRLSSRRDRSRSRRSFRLLRLHQWHRHLGPRPPRQRPNLLSRLLSFRHRHRHRHRHKRQRPHQQHRHKHRDRRPQQQHPSSRRHRLDLRRQRHKPHRHRSPPPHHSPKPRASIRHRRNRRGQRRLRPLLQQVSSRHSGRLRPHHRLRPVLSPRPHPRPHLTPHPGPHHRLSDRPEPRWGRVPMVDRRGASPIHPSQPLRRHRAEALLDPQCRAPWARRHYQSPQAHQAGPGQPAGQRLGAQSRDPRGRGGQHPSSLGAGRTLPPVPADGWTVAASAIRSPRGAGSDPRSSSY